MGNTPSQGEFDGKFIGVEEIGARLTEKRHSLGLSLETVAAKSGISVSTLSRMEKGDLKNPSAISVAMLGQLYGADLNELFAVEYRQTPDAERAHAAELATAVKEGELKAARVMADIYRKNYNRLLIVCALLLPVAIGYLIWDITLHSAGLFQATGISLLTIPVVAAVAAAVVAVVLAVVQRVVKTRQIK